MAQQPPRSAKPPEIQPKGRKETIARLIAKHSDAMLSTIVGSR